MDVSGVTLGSVPCPEILQNRLEEPGIKPLTYWPTFISQKAEQVVYQRCMYKDKITSANQL